MKEQKKRAISKAFKFSNKNDEKVFTTFLIILAIASFLLFLYDQYPLSGPMLYENETFLDLFKQKTLQNNELIFIAKDYSNKNKILDNIDSYSISVARFNLGTKYSFLERTIGQDKAIEYINDFNFPLSYYEIRFYKEYEPEELAVFIDDFNNNVTGFMYYIPQNKEYPNLNKEEAKNLALDFLKDNGYNIENITENDYSSEKIQNRTDHYFKFKITDSAINTEYGETFLFLTMNIYGNKISGYDFNLFIPEDFNREINKELGSGNLLALLSMLATLIMFILGFAVLIARFIQKKVDWKFFFALSLICLLFLVLELINSYPSFKYNYSTDLSYGVYIGTVYILSLIMLVLSCIFIFVTGSAGASLTKELWKNKIDDLIDFSKKRFFTKNISNSIFRGYLIAMLSLGVTSIIYIIGSKFLGVWSLSTSSIDTLSVTFIPFFTVFVLSLISASIIEEFTYRLFGIAFFKKYTKSTFLAILIPTLIWAVAHSNYPTFPVYFRGIELLITGALFSYFYLRYNITTVITAHYLIDAIAIGAILLYSGNGFWILGEIIILFLPLIIALIGYFKNKK
jgi:hypothetical protein